MADLVLFHSILGLRPGVVDAADRLRAAGHVVLTPDFFEGKTFDDYPEAFNNLESMGGIPEIIRRTKAVANELPAEMVYAGFSMGGASAEFLAASRPGARAAVLLHAALPIEAFGISAWPTGLPVQVHYGTGDPFRERDELEPFERAVRASGSDFELFDYPVNGHLFTDRSLPKEYDEASAELLFTRVIEFLGRLDDAHAASVVVDLPHTGDSTLGDPRNS